MAYEHVRHKPEVAEFPSEEGYETAKLLDDQYEKLERCESDTGLVLMAYRKV